MNKTFTSILAAAIMAAAIPARAKNCPYIAKVHEFVPAPGQFVHNVPQIPEGATYEEALALASECLVSTEEPNPGMVSLGAFGGYVVFAFDHPVVNVAGEYDVKIYGNAFISSAQTGGGSCEPGIVMVSVDANGNGLPDDPWYEIKGADFDGKARQENYTVTYYKPAADHPAVTSPGNPAIIDAEYIRYTSNNPDDAEGYVMQNMYHRQSYWPSWLPGSPQTLTFTGTRLPNTAQDISGNGSYWWQPFFEWGYADNLPAAQDPGIKLEWAVDASGKPANLAKADFFKVYTAQQQQCGWLGETSTEVCGAEDLHPDAKPGAGIGEIEADTTFGDPSDPFGDSSDGSSATPVYYTLQGVRIASPLPGTVCIRVASGKAEKIRF